MCGIVGIYNRNPERAFVSKSELERMRDKMVHRGPNDSGIWISDDNIIGLAHRRLSIIDLNPLAAQPMTNAICKKYSPIWIVFNGEIYNHQNLRQRLISLGYNFQTDHSDTEVIIHGYAEWGIDALLEKLEGDFAISIWDERAQTLFLARDKIGVKPLYFYLDEEQLVFASEIKSILEKENIIPDVDSVALYHYLSFMTTPAPLTMFKNIFKLPAGTYLRIEKSFNPQAIKYWDPASNQVKVSDEEIINGEDKRDHSKNILSILENSIEKRMMSDVPFGVFLSGGVDSSTNVALMARHMSSPVDTFTVGFKDHLHLNELDQARIVSDKFKTNHHEVLIDEQDMREYLDDLIETQDEPLADWVCIPLHFVAKLAKDNGTTVIQVGEGADEQFSGYAAYMNYLKLYNKYFKPFQDYSPKFFQHTVSNIANSMAKIKPGFEIYADIISRASNDGDCFWSGAHAFPDIAKDKLFNKNSEINLSSYNHILEMGLIEKDELQFKTSEVIAKQTKYFNSNSNNRDILAEMAFKELSLRLPELLLMRVDKITMAHSLEARVPFLDDKLVSYTMSIPWKHKIKGGVPKQILKKAIEGTLPNEIIYRKKMGFNAPMAQWLRSDFGHEVEEKIFNSTMLDRGFFDEEYIKDLIFNHRNDKADNSLYIWTIYNVVAWYDFWVD